jgi:hypothetical protein
MYTPVMFDFTTEDRYWIEQDDSLKAVNLVRFCQELFWTFGNGCTTRVCNLMGVQLNGCTVEWVWSSWCVVLSRKDSSVTQ